MSKKNLCFINTKVFLLLIVFLAVFAFAGTAGASTYYVNASGSADYTTIQDAINSSNDNDTIIVYDGTYLENIEVNCGISLLADSDNAIVISQSSELPVIEVVSDDVIIDGFYVDAYNNSTSGIFVVECNNVTISDNTVLNASIADFPSRADMRANYSLIVLLNSSDATVQGNNLSNAFAGIGLVSGSDISLIGNDISNVSRGIKTCLGREGSSPYIWEYEKGTDICILDNTITNIGDRGIEILSDNTTISGNVIDGIGYGNAQIASIYSYGGYMGIKVGCDNNEAVNCTVSDNTITNFTYDYFTDDEIEQQTGIQLKNVTECLIDGNTISAFYNINSSDTERQTGIHACEFHNTTISDNEIFSLYINDSDLERQTGIFVGGYYPPATNITVDGNIIHSMYVTDSDINRQDAIAIHSLQTCTAEHNEIYSMYMLNTTFSRQDGIALHSDRSESPQDYDISYNNVYSLYVNDSYFNRQHGIITHEAENITVEYNTVDSLYVDNSAYSDSVIVPSSEFSILSSGEGSIHQSGIEIRGAYDSDILDNTVETVYLTNPIVIQAEDKQGGIIMYESENVTIADNDISDIYAEYVGKQSGVKVKDSDDCIVSGNEISDVVIDNGNVTGGDYDEGQQAGIFFHVSYNGTISNNTIEGINIVVPRCMEAGIFAGDFDDSFILDNTIKNTNSTGLTMEETSGTNVTGNTVRDCVQGGLYIGDSDDNLIYNNYFNNEENVIFGYSGYTNTWNITKTAGENIIGGSYLGGNYWVHPNGTGFSVETSDSNKDGICDDEFVLFENETDYFPLAREISSSSSSSSGSRSYVGPSMPPETVNSTDSSIKHILGGNNVSYDFGDPKGPVLGISFYAKNDVGVVVANVQVLEESPEETGGMPDGMSYEIMSITLGTEGTVSADNADNILVEFRVSMEWIEENNIDPSTIRLMRFHDGEWQELPTNQIVEDGGYMYFLAETPGFSIFSIVGDEAIESVEEDSVEDDAEEGVGTVAEEPESTPGFTSVITFGLLAIAFLVVRRKN